MTFNRALLIYRMCVGWQPFDDLMRLKYTLSSWEHYRDSLDTEDKQKQFIEAIRETLIEVSK